MNLKNLILLILFLATNFSSCTQKGEEPCLCCESDEGGSNDVSLNGTSWKLASIVDAKTCELKELEPKDCAECFTLTFDSDYTAIVRSISVTMKLDLLDLNPNIDIEDVLWYEIYDEDGKAYSDSHTFRIAILIIGSYAVTPKELKLYYSESLYLLFKPFKP